MWLIKNWVEKIWKINQTLYDEEELEVDDDNGAFKADTRKHSYINSVK